jgi:Uma2 family endonuclease
MIVLRAMTEPRAPKSTRDAPPEPPVSYEEFLAWADEDVRAEWVDGEIHVMSPASDRHQEVVEFLLALGRLLVEHHGEGWVRSSVFQMKLDVRPRGREPDLMYVREENRDRVRETYLDGPADLVVEVVSSESGARDRGEKFYEYEAAGIPEYWLVDPQREELAVYRLQEGRSRDSSRDTSSRRSGRYRTAFEGHEGRAASAVLEGFWIEAEWLWQDELPPVLEVLRRWNLLA